MRRRSTPPLWFVIVVAAAAALAWRELAALGDAAGAGAGDANPPSLAFWGLFLTVAGWVWKGLQAIGQATLAALSALVNYLWAFAIAIHNAVIALGKTLWAVLRRSWGFLRATYEHVLRPAWQKFWKFVQWAEHALHELFAPVIRFVRFLRKWVLDFYTKYIRPILDTIDVFRKVTKALGALGLDWARALDRRLSDLESRIEAPFRYVVSVLNDVLNVINRIVTADGLFQRLTLLRTLERDFSEWAGMFWRGQVRALTGAERIAARKLPEVKTPQEHGGELAVAISDGIGPIPARVDEDAADVVRLLLSIPWRR